MGPRLLREDAAVLRAEHHLAACTRFFLEAKRSELGSFQGCFICQVTTRGYFAAMGAGKRLPSGRGLSSKCLSPRESLENTFKASVLCWKLELTKPSPKKEQTIRRVHQWDFNGGVATQHSCRLQQTLGLMFNLLDLWWTSFTSFPHHVRTP